MTLIFQLRFRGKRLDGVFEYPIFNDVKNIYNCSLLYREAQMHTDT